MTSYMSEIYIEAGTSSPKLWEGGRTLWLSERSERNHSFLKYFGLCNVHILYRVQKIFNFFAMLAIFKSKILQQIQMKTGNPDT